MTQNLTLCDTMTIYYISMHVLNRYVEFMKTHHELPGK